jgi:SAM-dependent methyltransferase
MRSEIRAYYDRGGEDGRLLAGAGRLEFLRTWDVLTRALPGPPAAVLDVGGATGVYAAPLAGRGYVVHLVDPVPSHVDVAAAQPGVTAAVGDARALDRPDASADAVLLLGPLYHLVDRADRLAAWREAGRVLRPGGVMVAATINRFASMLDGLGRNLLERPEFFDVILSDLATGQHRNLTDVPGWFTTAYFHHPDEPAIEATEAGLVVDRVVLVEGPLWILERIGEILADETRTAQVLDLLRQVETEPSLFGASAHLLTVARRPA